MAIGQARGALRALSSAVIVTLLTAGVSLGPWFHQAARAGHCLRRPSTHIPCFHWNRKTGLSVATVYLLDHTGARWPVRNAANTWNSAATLDTIWRWYTNGCPTTPTGAQHHCVHVEEYNDPNARNPDGSVQTGLTIIQADANNHLIDGVVAVRLNNAFADGTATNRNRHVTCQEQGHAVGLDHQLREWAGPPNNWGVSCMMNPTTGDGPNPNGHDYYTLQADMYNH